MFLATMLAYSTVVGGVTTELYRKPSSCQAVKNRGVRFNILHQRSYDVNPGKHIRPDGPEVEPVVMCVKSHV